MAETMRESQFFSIMLVVSLKQRDKLYSQIYNLMIDCIFFFSNINVIFLIKIEYLGAKLKAKLTQSIYVY